VPAELQQAGEEHIRQTRREWVIQRVAWVIMVLILIAALIGFFGNGPWSKRTAMSEDGGLSVEYQRVIRFQAQTELQIRLEAEGDSPATLVIGEGYLEHFELKSVVPEPETQQAGEGELILTFRPLRASEPVEVTVRAKVEELGQVAGVFTLQTGGVASVPRRVRIEQFSLP
jgi:hypothetical protein